MKNLIFIFLLALFLLPTTLLADKKISELNAITSALILDGDLMPIVDTSATETKHVLISQLDTRWLDVAQDVDGTTATYYLSFTSDGDGGTALAANRSVIFDVYNANRNIDLQGDIDLAGTLTTAAAVTQTGSALTVAVEDAAGSITLDNVSVEFEDTVGSGKTFKFVNATDDASRTVTLSENLTIGDGAALTFTAEDAAGSIVLDEQTFEVEGEGTASRLMKLVNASDAAATLTIDGTSGSIDQDVSTTGAPAFATGVVIGTATIASGSITDSSGAITFVNENLTTTGIVSAGALTNTGTLTTENGLITHSYDDALADDAEVAIATGVSGWGIAVAGNNEAMCAFSFTEAGVVTSLSDSDAACAVADTDAKLAVYQNAGTNGILIKNRLGGSKQIKFRVHY